MIYPAADDLITPLLMVEAVESTLQAQSRAAQDSPTQARIHLGDGQHCNHALKAAFKESPDAGVTSRAKAYAILYSVTPWP